ncbi:MAG TPA: hypothetical protein VET88_00420 [Gammaproteobacteria bacterium]|nr:hypothetical protein [Gammaproteobacteria bacterium]
MLLPQSDAIAAPSLVTWLQADGMLMLVLLILLIGSHIAGSRHFLARLLIVFLALRLVLLGNPWVWQLYAEKLQFADVGWRQYSVIDNMRDSYLSDGRQPRYLAVGSSQTEKLYSYHAKRHADFEIFGLAGMTPLDLLMFRRQIAARNPEVILLYLSDFDIARQIPPESISMAPRQGAGMIQLWSWFGALSAGDTYERAKVELLAGEIFPEFKYGFVFRGIGNKIMHRVAKRVGRQTPTQPSGWTPLDVRVKLLRETIATEYIDTGVSLLRAFLEFTATINTRVVIVEGQYHPAVFDEATLKANREVAARLSALAADFGHASYIPRSLTGEFTAEDYTDLTHVRSRAGRDFTTRLLGLLETDRHTDTQD